MSSLMLLAIIAIPFASMAEDEQQFPLRSSYPFLTGIDSKSLAEIFDSAIKIDSRNQMEFSVIRMTGAINIPADRMNQEQLLALRPKTSPVPIVFYCNGITCPKSYKAADKAVDWGFENVKIYESGIFSWSKDYPEKTDFFGKILSATEMEDMVLNPERFEKVLLTPEKFIEKVHSGQYRIIDIRDTNERFDKPFRLPRVLVLSFDSLVQLLEKKSSAIPREHVLVIDNVGRQVKWLQYFFEKEGVKEYYFLKGGMRKWIEEGYDSSGHKLS
ncbi:MAG: hypothetical protein KKE17_13345 [Proteobacteria bacterium]|nr:hypothetical protein [Pseudomonadota bacterium]MBU1710981.1 hypothetical protein [Pseudomonadota bacterium]